MSTITVCCVFGADASILRQTLPSWLPFADSIVLQNTSDPRLWCHLAKLDIRCPVIRQEVPWTDDFACHRNKAILAAPSPWVLMMDADEELLQPGPLGSDFGLRGSLRRFEQHYKPPPGLGFPIYERADGELACVGMRVRLFRPGDGWRYRYVCDPLPIPPKGAKIAYSSPGGIRVIHYSHSMRSSSLERKERQIWKRLCRGDRVPDEELEHYQNALEFVSGES